MVLRVLVLILALALPGGGAAMPRVLTGAATVVDGDTIRIEGVRVRLAAIDAPERGQVCTRAGRARDCGAEAAAALAALIAGRPVACAHGGRTSYGRVVAMCSAGGAVLSVSMAAQGMAVVERRYLRDWPDQAAALVAAEAEARAARRGLWAGDFDRPADWRWRAAPAG